VLRARTSVVMVGLVVAVLLGASLFLSAEAQQSTRVRHGENFWPYAIFILGTLGVVYLLFRGSKHI